MTERLFLLVIALAGKIQQAQIKQGMIAANMGLTPCWHWTKWQRAGYQCQRLVMAAVRTELRSCANR